MINYRKIYKSVLKKHLAHKKEWDEFEKEEAERYNYKEA